MDGDHTTPNDFTGIEYKTNDNSQCLIPQRPATLFQMKSNGSSEIGIVQTSDINNTEFVTPTGNVQVTLLHPHSCEMLAAMQNSIHSDGSSNNSNDDVCILQANGSRYATGIITERSKNNSSGTDHSGSFLDAADFTVVHTPRATVLDPSTQSSEKELGNQMQEQSFCPPPLQHHESISCDFEESTEVLLMHSTECNSRSFGSHAYSGTDSDVEILMSEEIVESDWSAGCIATCEMKRTPDEPNGTAITPKAPRPTSGTNGKNVTNCSDKATSFASVRQESTDQDISVEEFSQSSISTCEQLTRAQLIKVISEQATYIQKLENTLQRHRRAHRTLFEHVEALRMALNADDVFPITHVPTKPATETNHLDLMRSLEI